jgi:hypothetical protein
LSVAIVTVAFGIGVPAESWTVPATFPGGGEAGRTCGEANANADRKTPAATRATE